MPHVKPWRGESKNDSDIDSLMCVLFNLRREYCPYGPVPLYRSWSTPPKKEWGVCSNNREISKLNVAFENDPCRMSACMSTYSCMRVCPCTLSLCNGMFIVGPMFHVPSHCMSISMYVPGPRSHVPNHCSSICMCMYAWTWTIAVAYVCVCMHVPCP